MNDSNGDAAALPHGFSNLYQAPKRILVVTAMHQIDHSSAVLMKLGLNYVVSLYLKCQSSL